MRDDGQLTVMYGPEKALDRVVCLLLRPMLSSMTLLVRPSRAMWWTLPIVLGLASNTMLHFVPSVVYVACRKQVPHSVRPTLF